MQAFGRKSIATKICTLLVMWSTVSIVGHTPPFQELGRPLVYLIPLYRQNKVQVWFLLPFVTSGQPQACFLFDAVSATPFLSAILSQLISPAFHP
jgi:hypothetical protein